MQMQLRGSSKRKNQAGNPAVSKASVESRDALDTMSWRETKSLSARNRFNIDISAPPIIQ